MSASTSRSLPPEIADFVNVKALIERGEAQGSIASDEIRQAFEADQIPATQWKNVLRSLNQVLDQEGVDIVVNAADSAAPKRTRKSVAAKSTAKRTSTKTVVSGTAARAAAPAAAAPAAAEAEAAEQPKAAAKTAAKKTAAKSAAGAPAKKAVAKKTAAKKATAGKGEGDPELDAEELTDEPEIAPEPGAAEPEDENQGFVLSDDDEDDAPAQQVAVAGRHRRPGQGLPEADRQGPAAQRGAGGRTRQAHRGRPVRRGQAELRREAPLRSSRSSWRSSPRTGAAPRTTCWRPTSVSWSRWPSAIPAAACSSWT
ncbi:RNA polymerase sigma factor region1.1 domain-containing protein [Yinghuangia aomiensis]